MDARPQGRRAGLMVHAGDERGVEILDTTAGTVHRLDTTTARVWHAADGEHSVIEVAAAADVSLAMAAAALDRLRGHGLLVSEPAVARRNVLEFSLPVG